MKGFLHLAHARVYHTLQSNHIIQMNKYAIGRTKAPWPTTPKPQIPKTKFTSLCQNMCGNYQHINLIIVVSLHSINYDSTMLLRLHFGLAIELQHTSYLFYELLYDVLVVHMFHHMSYQVHKLYGAF